MLGDSLASVCQSQSVFAPASPGASLVVGEEEARADRAHRHIKALPRDDRGRAALGAGLLTRLLQLGSPWHQGWTTLSRAAGGICPARPLLALRCCRVSPRGHAFT